MGRVSSEELLRHLDAAYSFARWLTGNEADARDAVHDAFVRALRFRGEVKTPKTWFLTVVRNAAYTALKKRVPLLEDGDAQTAENEPSAEASPEEEALKRADVELVRAALGAVAEEYREIFVLREIEELSYQELAEVLHVPLGTVMSRLARARTRVLEQVRKREGS